MSQLKKVQINQIKWHQASKPYIFRKHILAIGRSESAVSLGRAGRKSENISFPYTVYMSQVWCNVGRNSRLLVNK
jgi:hypothetical protein